MRATARRRYVVISETALKQIIRELRLGSANRPEAEFFETKTGKDTIE